MCRELLKRTPGFRWWLRPLLVGGGILGIMFGAWVLCISIAFSPMCGNDSIVEFVSPNGQFKAVIFRRSCGATTGFSTQVSVIPAKRDLPNEGGNVFVTKNEPKIRVRWVDDRSLVISGDTQTEFLRLTQLDEIRITYE